MTIEEHNVLAAAALGYQLTSEYPNEDPMRIADAVADEVLRFKEGALPANVVLRMLEADVYEEKARP